MTRLGLWSVLAVFALHTDGGLWLPPIVFASWLTFWAATLDRSAGHGPLDKIKL